MKTKFKKIFIIFLILIFACIIVYADDEETEEFFSFSENIIPTSSDVTSEPQVNARHAVVFDRISKKTIYGKNQNERCKMASTTKIMTAIVTLENASLSDIVIISKRSARNRWLSFRFIRK